MSKDKAQSSEMPKIFHCGRIAIVGRPNVGKSTLLNQCIGQKLSIISRKPQTTRHRILGIKTTPTAQFIYVDTPGLHQDTPRALNRYMNRTAQHAIHDVHLILFMVDSLRWKKEDDWVLQKIQQTKTPIILIVNKVDKISNKTLLLPYLEGLAKKADFAEIIPLSARKISDMKKLEQTIVSYLPVGEAQFATDQITDRSERFFAAEIIREKLMRSLGQELPYVTTVEIENFQEKEGQLRISAVIYVDKAGQKAIVIGEKGARLKQIGKQARLDMQILFGAKIFLELWVKVKQGWADDEKALQRLGYDIPMGES